MSRRGAVQQGILDMSRLDQRIADGAAFCVFGWMAGET